MSLNWKLVLQKRHNGKLQFETKESVFNCKFSFSSLNHGGLRK